MSKQLYEYICPIMSEYEKRGEYVKCEGANCVAYEENNIAKDTYIPGWRCTATNSPWRELPEETNE